MTITLNPYTNFNLSATPYLGLAPFLRASIAGIDFSGASQTLLEQAQTATGDANLWMNLATALLCLGQRDAGLGVQDCALQMSRVYYLPAATQPARRRLLMLVAPGDLAANTPIDCLLENGNVDLYLYYVRPGDLFPAPVPEHDVLLVGVSEGDSHRQLLAELDQALRDWPRPVINAPQRIPVVERTAASVLLEDAPGVLMPRTERATRAQLAAVAAGDCAIADVCPDCTFPLIVRPVGSHAGHDLERIETVAALGAYLAGVAAEAFFVSRFIDYRGADGQFRKFRIALIDGAAFACHMAVSTDWMIHYVNAGMYEEAPKRAEEAAFMADFDAFAARHRAALAAIADRSGLGYVCIDGAEMPDGRLLIFEIDHAMVVHAMDPEDLFPYKQQQMARVQRAFCDYLERLAAEPAA